MFFNKPWSDVSDADIDKLSTKLEREMGGWIFHSKVDFSRPTPYISVGTDHPKFIISWLESL